MCGKVLICALTLMGLMSPIMSVSLTKEISADTLVKNNDNIGELVLNGLLDNPEEGLASLASLLTDKINPEVSDVLEIFNSMFQTKLLIIKGDYIELDQEVLRTFVQSKLRLVLKAVFPGNPLQQMAYLSALQGQLEKALSDLATQSNKLSLEKVEALLSATRTRGLSTVETRDVLSEIYNTVARSVCNIFIKQALNQLNIVLTGVTSTLTSVTDGLNNEILKNIVVLLKRASANAMDYANTLSSNYCGNLTLSRKRRDVEETRLVALDASTRTDAAFMNIISGILDVILGFVTQQLNSLAKAVASLFLKNVVQAAVDRFLQNEVLSVVYAIINSVLVYK